MNKFKFFLIAFFSIFIGHILTTNVYAESATFYEAEYIDGIYMKKYNPHQKITYYQTARFFRKTNTNEFAYCVEPFAFFEKTASYESTLNPDNLSASQKDRISKIAYFGYGYKNHTDPKWYAVAQLMIWQTANPEGDFYFSDTLTGNRIVAYTSEINEINNLINNYSALPSIANKEYTIVEDQQLEVKDNSNILNNYKTNSNDISISNNTLRIKPLKEGNYEYTLTKNDNIYNKPYIFYQAGNSQNVIITGDLNNIQTKIKVKVIKTKLELTKIDKDNKSTTPKGEASLDGAIYKLYDENMNEQEELTIKDNKAIINNLNLGKYYLQEIKPGTGYNLDTNKYEINITESNNTIELNLENKVIEKKIIIEKKFGSNNKYNYEKNISFNILDKNNKLIDTKTTDSNGHIEITLPFGSYKFIQVNSTEGYSKVDPFTVEVVDNEDELIELKDLKIPVPNTHTDTNNNLLLLIFQILLIII